MIPKWTVGSPHEGVDVRPILHFSIGHITFTDFVAVSVLDRVEINHLRNAGKIRADTI